MSSCKPLESTKVSMLGCDPIVTSELSAKVKPNLEFAPHLNSSLPSCTNSRISRISLSTIVVFWMARVNVLTLLMAVNSVQSISFIRSMTVKSATRSKRSR